MGRKCFLCEYNEKQKDPEVCMHKFPKNAHTRAAWFKVCGLEEGVDDVRGVRICSKHFVSDDFHPPTTTLTKPVKKLKSGRIPSIPKVHRKAFAYQQTLPSPSTSTSTECIEQTTCVSALSRAATGYEDELFEGATTSQKISDAVAPNSYYTAEDCANIVAESSAGLLLDPERSFEQGLHEVTTSENTELLQEEVLPVASFLLNLRHSIQADPLLECSELEEVVAEASEETPIIRTLRKRKFGEPMYVSKIVETKTRKTTSQKASDTVAPNSYTAEDCANIEESSPGLLLDPERSFEQSLHEVTTSENTELLQEEVLPVASFLLNLSHSVQTDPLLECSELEVVAEAPEETPIMRTLRKRKFGEPLYVSEIVETETRKTTSQKTFDAAAPNSYTAEDCANIVAESSAGLLLDPERSFEQGLHEVTTSEDTVFLQEEVVPVASFLLNLPHSIQADPSMECSELEEVIAEASGNISSLACRSHPRMLVAQTIHISITV